MRRAPRLIASSVAALAGGILVASCTSPAPPPSLRADGPAALPNPGAFEVGETPARSFSIAIHVDEPAGIERKNEPVLAAVPLPIEAGIRKPGELLLVTDTNVVVPSQARVLARWGGPVKDEARAARWVLVAFEADVGPHRTKELRLVRRTNEVKPAHPVVVKVDGARGSIDTGAVHVKLGGAGPIESIARPGGESLAGAVAGLLRTSGGEPVACGPPESIEVVEAGPVRALVRLHGAYGTSGLRYALTVEGWTGRSDLRLALETRNSDPRTARTIKLDELSLQVKLARAVEAVATPEGERPLAGTDALVLEQLPPAKENQPAPFALGIEGGARIHEGNDHAGWVATRSARATVGAGLRKPVGRAPSGVRVAKDSLVVRFLVPPREKDATPIRNRFLGDLQHRTDECVLFFSGADDPEPGPLVAGYRARLQGQPNASWVRDAGGLLGPVADENDERAAYAACGLELLPPAAAVKRPLRCEREVGDVNIKWNTESDEARDLFSLWVRTGEREAFDEACAWAEFLRDRYAPRTDGFAFAASEGRRSSDAGELVDAAKHLSGARMKESHLYGEGLVAHYLLTGDPGSLEAARDLLEFVDARFGKVRPEAPIIEVRCFARPLQTACALYEVSGDEKDRALVDALVANAFASATRDRGRGCYAFKLYVGDFDLNDELPPGLSLPDRFPGDAAKGLFAKGPRKVSIKGERAAFCFQDRELGHALARAFELTGDERARQALLGLAEFWLDEGLVPVFFKPELLVTPYFVAPYVPEPELGRYPTPSSSIYTTNLGVIEAAAYLVSGDPRFLALAKKCLRVAALRGHRDLRPISPDERKPRLATRNQWAHGWDDIRTFVALGGAPARSKEADARPAPPKDVSVRAGAKPDTIELAFTPTPGAVRYLVYASPVPIAERKGDGDASWGAFGAEPIKVLAGAKGGARTVIPVPGRARHFFVRAEDAQGRLSNPSNVTTP